MYSEGPSAHLNLESCLYTDSELHRCRCLKIVQGVPGGRGMFLVVVGASRCVPAAVVCSVYIIFVAAAFLHQSLEFFCVNSNMLVSACLGSIQKHVVFLKS